MESGKRDRQVDNNINPEIDFNSFKKSNNELTIEYTKYINTNRNENMKYKNYIHF